MFGLKENSNFGSYHPIVNFIYFMIIIIVSMSSMNPILLAMSFLGAFIYSIILKGTSAVKFNIYFIIPVILLTTILNPLFYHDGVTIIFYMMGNAVTFEAVLYGLAMGVMLSSVLLWFTCYQVIMTSDKFIYLFGRILPSIALTISMAFRFIPLIKKRFGEITQGQKCMGRDFREGSFLSRVRQFTKEISILIAWSLEASIETADSMEARGYGIKGRSSFSLFRFVKRDGILLGLIMLMGIIVMTGCLLKKMSIYYYPAIIFPKTNIYTYVISLLYAVLLFLPIGIDIGGELRWKQLRSEM